MGNFAVHPPLSVSSNVYASAMIIYFQVLNRLYPQKKSYPKMEPTTDIQSTFHSKMLSKLSKFYDNAIRNSTEINTNTIKEVLGQKQHVLSLNNKKSISLLAEHIPSEIEMNKFVIHVSSSSSSSSTILDKVEEELLKRCNDANAKTDKTILFVTTEIDSKKKTRNNTFFYPLTLKVKNNSSDGSQYFYRYDLTAVVYRNQKNEKDLVFRMIGRNTKLHYNQYSIFQWTLDSFNGTFNDNCFASVLDLNIKKPTKQISNFHEVNGVLYNSVETVWTLVGNVMDNNESILSYKGCDLCFNDFRASLLDDGFIDDRVVDCLIHQALDYFKNRKHFYMDSNVVNTMVFETYHFNDVSSWSSGAYDNGESLFDPNNFIHFTVSYPPQTHWYYGIVVMQSKSIVVVDSYSAGSEYTIDKRNFVANLFLTFLKEEHTAHFGENTFNVKEWSTYIDNIVPQQTDTFSCGIFVTLFSIRAMALPNDLEHFTWNSSFDESDLLTIRKLMIDVLLLRKEFTELLNIALGGT
jgi:hypothetical protein